MEVWSDSNQLMDPKFMGRNQARRGAVMHENITDTTNSKGIRHIAYGANIQHKKVHPK